MENSDQKMNTRNITDVIERKTLFSSLWLFILLNIIFRDIHEFLRPGVLEEIMTGYVNGQKMTAGLFLIGAILVEIPILMVLLSRVLKYKVNRWANIIASVLTIAVVLSNVPKDMDDIFFEAVELVALSVIIWFAWKWKDSEA